ncbi:hypothetical protein F2Q70_00015650 [Brassica cretica]|uniref:Uncharacterized protein n=1 Tax=Brassica cretica TaxID=69181 RepID=A0A8S9I562_BRACR|nr:hypothetical protein F2Q70_00015650 [Brassica cretica]
MLQVSQRYLGAVSSNRCENTLPPARFVLVAAVCVILSCYLRDFTSTFHFPTLVYLKQAKDMGKDRGPGTARIGDVGTSSRAGTRTNPPRASRPTPNPPAQVSRRKAPREKSPADRATLEAEIEEMIEEGLRAETEDEEEEAPAPKPAKKRKRVPPTVMLIQFGLVYLSVSNTNMKKSLFLFLLNL